MEGLDVGVNDAGLGLVGVGVGKMFWVSLIRQICVG